jgi:hypothetical protein
MTGIANCLRDSADVGPKVPAQQTEPLQMDKSEYEYDFRQLLLMGDQLTQFTVGKISLAHLISGLNALVNCLRTVDQTWRDKFKSEWGALKQIYANALERQEGALTPEDSVLVNEAVATLQALVERVARPSVIGPPES